jgi:hypothetical protein
LNNILSIFEEAQLKIPEAPVQGVPQPRLADTQTRNNADAVLDKPTVSGGSGSGGARRTGSSAENNAEAGPVVSGRSGSGEAGGAGAPAENLLDGVLDKSEAGPAVSASGEAGGAEGPAEKEQTPPPATQADKVLRSFKKLLSSMATVLDEGKEALQALEELEGGLSADEEEIMQTLRQAHEVMNVTRGLGGNQPLCKQA